MAYRYFMGKYYLSNADRLEIVQRTGEIRAYHEKILAEIRRQEEEEQKREFERRKEEERKRELKRREEQQRQHAQKQTYDGPRYSLSIGEISNDDLFDTADLALFTETLSGSKMTRSIPLDMTFTEQLYHLMQKKGKTNAEVYKAALIDKSLFSRITSDKHYSPSKETAVAIALALELTLEEAQDLLKRAGFTLSHAILRDAAIEFCFREKIYNVVKVNIMLDNLNCAPLSRIRY